MKQREIYVLLCAIWYNGDYIFSTLFHLNLISGKNNEK